MNRGVMICDECCSVHRSLGRHISQVKHLQHSSWSETLRAVMLSSLFFVDDEGISSSLRSVVSGIKEN